MFSVNFAKFVRTLFTLKTTGTWEIHKDKEQHKNYAEIEMRLKIFSSRPHLSVRKDQTF